MGTNRQAKTERQTGRYSTKTKTTAAAVRSQHVTKQRTKKDEDADENKYCVTNKRTKKATWYIHKHTRVRMNTTGVQKAEELSRAKILVSA